MAFNSSSLDSYVDVAERIAQFREQYPTGSLQPADPSEPYRIVTIGDRTFVVVVAAAYRTPDDPRPGIGSAWEPWPGTTPYTKNSELQNAETSAWGRAIVAALAADSRRGVASADEVRNRVAERQTSATETREQLDRYNILAGRIARASNELELGAIWPDVVADVQAERLTADQGNALRNALATRKANLPTPDQAEDWPPVATETAA